MLASSKPDSIQLPFGADAGAGYIRVIPVASQIGINNGEASYTDGFVPLNATPVASGGIPPDIRDMNGILNAISAGLQWVQVGGFPRYNSTFASQIGGYPQGAILVNASGTGFFISTADNNTSNPNSGGSNWNQFPAVQQAFPVGSIFMNVTSTNPATLLGYGTWTSWGTGRMPIAVDPSNSLFNTPEETGGSANAIVVSHAHTINDPQHSHAYNDSGSHLGQPPQANANSNTGGVVNTASSATGITINSTGSSGTNANYPPFISVYMWKRTA